MKRAVRSLIRLIAAGLMIFGTLEICLEIAHHFVQVREHIEPATTNIWHYVIGAVLLVVGVILILGAESLAEQLTDDVDNTDENDHTDDTTGDTHK